ncbi:MAG: hypothetical protein QMD12_03390, partial [Candidatus Aenigmarchaeota archaeon]|nr:hypothetical protein [Candidatus Aenigmarchaeota archaeon]
SNQSLAQGAENPNPIFKARPCLSVTGVEGDTARRTSKSSMFCCPIQALATRARGRTTRVLQPKMPSGFHSSKRIMKSRDTNFPLKDEDRIEVEIKGKTLYKKSKK